MPREEHRRTTAIAQAPRAANPAVRAPYWRSLLEARWRARLQEVTELALAYHRAAAAVPEVPLAAASRSITPGQRELARLLRRTVAARRGLADVEEALARLTAGTFGSCEQCGSAIPAGLLAAAPEGRYCPRCDAPASPQPRLAAEWSPAPR
jgi:RNA polymerase-binding transcription factor DksA